MSLVNNMTVGDILNELQHLIDQGQIDRTTATTVTRVRRRVTTMCHVDFDNGVDIRRLESEVDHWRTKYNIALEDLADVRASLARSQ